MLSVCPWLLLSVMAYGTFIGNCRRLSLKGHMVSAEVVIMRGMYAFAPLAFLVIISPSITLLINLVTINLVPLQRPCHTPFQEIGNEASIRVPRMFKSHAWQQYDKQMQCY
jgi:hypothetical protein